MSQYEQSLSINAKPDAILDFISDIKNLPKYLPTTKSAQSQGPDRVQVQGSAHGHAYNADGYLRCDRARKRIEWGSDEGHYSGWMSVSDAGSDASSTVTVSIQMSQKPGQGSGRAPSDSDINEGLQKSLESIKNYMEKDGGKVEPRAAS